MWKSQKITYSRIDVKNRNFRKLYFFLKLGPDTLHLTNFHMSMTIFGETIAIFVFWRFVLEVPEKS